MHEDAVVDRVIGGRYELREQLSDSSWQGWDPVLGRSVLVTLLPSGANLEALRGHAVIPVVDCGDGFVVTETVAGIALSGSSLPPSALSALLAQVAEGLQLLHDQGLGHGGISLDHLVLRADGVVVLTGFAFSGSPSDDLLAFSAVASELLERPVSAASAQELAATLRGLFPPIPFPPAPVTAPPAPSAPAPPPFDPRPLESAPTEPTSAEPALPSYEARPVPADGRFGSPPSTSPALDETAPALGESSPEPQETAPAFNQPPAFEETAPALDDATPEPRETWPVLEETAPALEETQDAFAQPAPPPARNAPGAPTAGAMPGAGAGAGASGGPAGAGRSGVPGSRSGGSVGSAGGIARARKTAAGRPVAGRPSVQGNPMAFTMSVSYPRRVAKGRSATFLVQIHAPEGLAAASQRLAQIFSEAAPAQALTHGQLRLGAEVEIALSSPDVQFSQPAKWTVTESGIDTAFWARPDETARGGEHTGVLTIRESGRDLASLPFTLTIADYALGKISRPAMRFALTGAGVAASIAILAYSQLNHVQEIAGLVTSALGAVVSAVVTERTTALYRRRAGNASTTVPAA